MDSFEGSAANQVVTATTCKGDNATQQERWILMTLLLTCSSLQVTDRKQLLFKCKQEYKGKMQFVSQKL